MACAASVATHKAEVANQVARASQTLYGTDLFETDNGVACARLVAAGAEARRSLAGTHFVMSKQECVTEVRGEIFARHSQHWGQP